MLFDISEKVISIKDDDDKESGATVKVKPLSVIDYQRLLTVVKTFNSFSEKKSEAEAAIDGLDKLSDEKVGAIIKHILPKYCYDLKGIDVRVDVENDQKVRAATIQDLVDYGAFYGVSFRILIELITISTATVDDKKK